MLYLIGIGLNDECDISLKAIEAMKNCDSVYCELYTGKWQGSFTKLEEQIGKKIQILKRENVESEFLINEAREDNITLLVPGDPLTATTHIGLILDAKKHKIDFQIIHSSSVYTAVAESGLQLYKFGRATTLIYPEENYEPTSPYEVIKRNREIGLHTLVLLDIKEDRQMSVKEAAELLLKHSAIREDEKIVACCCLGGRSVIKYNTADNLAKDKKLEKTPAVILIAGNLNFKEKEALELWK